MADKQIDRRGFIKGLGAAGAVASVAAVFSEARAAANDPSAYTGWESRQGKEYFNRSRVEVDSPESYEIVGKQYRRDSKTYDARGRGGTPPKEENSIKLLDEGDPFWVDYYKNNPVDGDGGSKEDNDRWLRDEWWPPQNEIVVNGADRRKEFELNKGYLAAVRAGAHMDFPFPRPDKPPEEWDWENVNPRRAEFKSPALASKYIKRIAADYSGTLCRITEVNPNWFYATGARGEDRGEYGTEFPIRPWWKYAIVVTRPMGFDTLMADPNYGCSYDGYTPSSFVGWHVYQAVKYMGYPSRLAAPRVGYEQFVVPFAVDAGFGELGRTCNCVSPDMGGNFRQSIILTDMPLEVDKPINAGVSDFCNECKICAEYCHTAAVPMDDEWNWEEAGVRRWDVNGLQCSTGWQQVSGRASHYDDPLRLGRALGGCRACIAVCPWFRKNNWLHNTVRQMVSRDPTGVSDKVAMFVERNFYDRNTPDTWIGDEMLGVGPVPDWLVTEDFIGGFSDTPLGGA